jgi:copper chaperone
MPQETEMNNQETVLKVTGMTCSSCVRHVSHALEEVNGVTRVDVRLATGEVRVQHDGSVPSNSLVTAVMDAGYEAKRDHPENSV